MPMFKCRGCRRTPVPVKWRGRCVVCGIPWDPIPVGTYDGKTKHTTAADALADRVGINYIPTGLNHFDSVLGGGLVRGQQILFGGPEGCGKSRLIAQMCQSLAGRIEGSILYASPEESVDDLLIMCKSVGATSDRIEIVGSQNYDTNDVLTICREKKPILLVLDSLQGADGWSTQNTSTAELIKEHCDTTGMCAIVMNHMTKSLLFKGGTTVPHMFKTILMLYEYSPQDDGKIRELFGTRFKRRVEAREVELTHIRTLMSGKNRFGSGGRKEFFLMSKEGLIPLEKKAPKSNLYLVGEDDQDESADDDI